MIERYLTIKALEDNLTVILSVNSCEYCINGDGNWISLSADTETSSINKGDTLSFRGNLTPTQSNGIGTFNVNKSFELMGNCMSMIFGDDTNSNNSLRSYSYAFAYLFKNCTTLKSVSENFLPATTLSEWCYGNMFMGCTSLIVAPALPAMKLEACCYVNMFSGCTSLLVAPVLPATTLARKCYGGMFSFCYSLIDSPVLPATTLADWCYSGMFHRCVSLTKSPVLPAEKLTKYCYMGMFYGCNKLEHIEMLATDINAERC